MTRDELERTEKILIDEVVRRRKLGGYSTDAEGILLLAESILAIVQHLRDSLPRKK